MSVPYVADYTLTTFFVTRQEAADPRRREGERFTEVGNNFFQTMGIRILAGRGFEPLDRESSPPVAVINESLARARFPHENAIGKLFRFGIPIEDKWVQVVGICAGTRYTSLRDSAPPQFFVPYSQRPEEAGGFRQMTYALRTDVQPAAILPALRRVVQQSHPDLPIVNIRTQEEQIDDNMRLERAFATLTATFGVLALLLACIGIYGIMSYSVSRSTNEIGIRMALGAQPGLVTRMVLGEAWWLTAVGIVAGMSGALALGRAIAAMLYGVKAYDAATFIASAMVLIVVALAASWIPARRAASIDPMQALRHE
jgi:predicted permease